MRSSCAQRTTIAIIGHSESTRMNAPYDRADTEIWGLNACHDWIPREDRHFDLHDRKTRPWAPGYLEYLTRFTGPVYLQFPDERIPTATILPMREMETIYGSVFGSSISWMFALAVEQQPKRIELWGCDLLYAEDDYTDQRESTGYWIGYARGKGIEVFLPLGCPILTSESYALVEQRGPVSNEFIHLRLKKIRAEQKALEIQQHVATGRFQELAFWQSVFAGELEAPGLNLGVPKRPHIPPRAES